VAVIIMPVVVMRMAVIVVPMVVIRMAVIVVPMVVVGVAVIIVPMVVVGVPVIVRMPVPEILQMQIRGFDQRHHLAARLDTGLRAREPGGEFLAHPEDQLCLRQCACLRRTKLEGMRIAAAIKQQISAADIAHHHLDKRMRDLEIRHHPQVFRCKRGSEHGAGQSEGVAHPILLVLSDTETYLT